MIARAFCSGPDMQSAALRGPGLALVGAIRAPVRATRLGPGASVQPVDSAPVLSLRPGFNPGSRSAFRRLTAARAVCCPSP